MHEVVPKVVAIAVSTVMAICRIFCQIVFASIFSVMSYELFFVCVFFFYCYPEERSDEGSEYIHFLCPRDSSLLLVRFAHRNSLLIL